MQHTIVSTVISVKVRYTGFASGNLSSSICTVTNAADVATVIVVILSVTVLGQSDDAACCQNSSSYGYQR